MTAPDFWSNRERAQADVEEVSRLRSLINPFQQLEREIEDFSALQELAAEESDPAHRAQAEKEVATEHDRLSHQLDEFELRQFLSGENDRSNAFVTIHSGAGGTESCDWADMLLRMYQRWIERGGFKSETVDFAIAPRQGMEYKYRLDKGEALLYSWKATGPVNVEFHAEPDGAPRGYAQSYEKVDHQTAASGTLTAPFPGIHGWFWENTTDKEVTVTLKSAGFYNLSHEFRNGQPTKNKMFQ